MSETTTERARALRKSMTRAEIILWQHLRRLQTGHRFRRQHPIGPYFADFACFKAKLVVEVDGATHSEDSEMDDDRQRTAHLNRLGWTVIRVTNSDVYENLDGVMRHITDALRMSDHRCPLRPASRATSPNGGR